MKNLTNEEEIIDEKLKSLFANEKLHSGLDGIDTINFTNKIMRKINAEKLAKQNLASTILGIFASIIMASLLIYWRELTQSFELILTAFAPIEMTQMDLASICFMIIILIGSSIYYFKSQ